VLKRVESTVHSCGYLTVFVCNVIRRTRRTRRMRRGMMRRRKMPWTMTRLKKW